MFHQCFKVIQIIDEVAVVSKVFFVFDVNVPRDYPILLSSFFFMPLNITGFLFQLRNDSFTLSSF